MPDPVDRLGEIRARREALAFGPAADDFIRNSAADVGWLLEHVEQLQATLRQADAVSSARAVDLRCLREQRDDLLATLETVQELRVAASSEAQQLQAQRQSVLDLCDKHEHGALRWQDPLPVPEWIPLVRAAAGAVHATDH